MLSANDIKNVKLAKAAVGGYKTEEVEMLLNKIVADYEEYESRLKKFQTKLEEAKQTVEQFKKEKGSINNVLVSAQQLADNIVAEAKKKADEIISAANADDEKIRNDSEALRAELAESNAAEREKLEKEMEEFINNNNLKKEAILKATDEAVERQQALFDKLRIETADFKKKVLAFYEDGISLINGMPESVPDNAKEIAKAVSLIVDEKINAEKIAEEVVNENKTGNSEKAENKPEERVSENKNKDSDEPKKSETEGNYVPDEAEKTVKRSFFSKKN